MAVLDGMSSEALQAMRASLQKAYFELAAGKSVASASYTQGDGAKNVSFRRTDMAAIAMTIAQIDKALGVTCRARRPLKPVFGGR